MSQFKQSLEKVGQIENWGQAPEIIIDLKEQFNLNLLAVLSPKEIESGHFVAQILDQIFEIMPPEIVIKMLTHVTPTTQPIDVYKTDDTIVLAYQPLDK